MRHGGPSIGGSLTPALRTKFAAWVQEHVERGCGDPFGGAAYQTDGRLQRLYCRCDCEDHRCIDAWPVPACTTCDDARVVAGSRDRADPFFGKARPCPDCTDDREQQRFAMASRLFGIDPEIVMGFPLDALDAGSVPRAGAETWLANGCRPPTLVFAGPVGTGKTHAALGIAGRLVDAGRFCLFSTASDLLQQLRDTFNATEARTLEGVLRLPLDVGLLVLDDLGAEKQTEWAHEQVFRVINYRYTTGLPTIVTTNLTPATAPQDRLWSRLFGDRFAQVLLTSGPDRRRED